MRFIFYKLPGIFYSENKITILKIKILEEPIIFVRFFYLKRCICGSKFVKLYKQAD